MTGESLNIINDQLEKLKQLFPEAVTEGKIDWEKLQATLGKENIEFRNERYVLNWAGKSDAFIVLQQATTATLKPVTGESVNFDNTENVFIEGENLEVLKVLQKSYYGKIKCIIIDPPYNTGNDSFIYPDRFKESKEDYQKRVGDKDEEGYLLKEGLFRKNSRDSGHFHSNWLSMIYPRLFLARNLLTDDGVIFIHIDDNEVHNLRLIMNEIFGEENFVATLIWNLRSGTQAGHFTRSHEYVLVYGKNKEGLKYFEDLNGGAINHGALKFISKANPASEITFPEGMEYEGTDAVFSDEIGGNEKQFITGEMIFKNGKLLKPVTIKAGWAMKNQVLSWLDGKETFDSKGQRVKRFYFNSSGILWYEKERSTIHPKTVLPDTVGNTKTGSDEIIDIFGTKLFDFPKPSSLEIFLVGICASKANDIILDFFAGSGSTAQAVLELNKEDGGNRKFILVQLPEKCEESSEAYKAGYRTIADISKERIRRVIKRLETEAEEIKKRRAGELPLEKSEIKNPLPIAIGTEIAPGFKVFKLTPSNFKIWRGAEVTEETLEAQLDAFTDPVKPESITGNMLYELILKSGYMLTDKIESKGKYYSVNNGELAVALDDMNPALVEEIISSRPQKVITLDKLFTGNDQLKTNTVLQMKDAEIDFKTV